MNLRSLRTFLFGTLRGRLIISMAFVLAVTMTIFIVVMTLQQRTAIMDNQLDNAIAMSQSLATSSAGWLASDDISGMQEQVEAKLRYPDVIFAMLADNDGRILAHTDKSKIGLYLTDLPKDVRQDILNKTAALVDVAVPAMLGKTHVGWARVGIGQKTAAAKLKTITIAGILYALAAVAIGLVVSWSMGHRITRRLYAVQETINLVKAGDRTARSGITGSDEAAAMAREFNIMLDALAEREKERRKAEEELKRTNQRNEMILNSAGEGIYGTDVSGNILFINKTAVDMFGYTMDQVIGKNSHELFHHKKADGSPYPAEDCPLHKSLTYGETCRGTDEVFWRRDGSMFSVEHVNTPLVDKGVVVGAVVVFRDITERKKAEEEIRRLNESLEDRVERRTAELNNRSKELQDSQTALMNIVEDLNEMTAELATANERLKELDRLKSMFIATMSHELRTPLNSIIGFSSIMLDEWVGPVNAEQKEDLAAILRSGKHLLNLINDVIDISKIEAGKIEFSYEDFDLYDVISEAAGLFRKDVLDKGLEFSAEPIHLDMHTDRRRLLQCVVNLISNAVKFTEKGSVRISARAASSHKFQVSRKDINTDSRFKMQDSSKEPETSQKADLQLATCNLQLDGDMVEISVSDTGIGIKKEDMSKLFGAFVRVHSPEVIAIKGTGLGLYLTKKIVADILKGEITAESEYGKGSRFVIKIPVRCEKGVENEKGAGDRRQSR